MSVTPRPTALLALLLLCTASLAAGRKLRIHNGVPADRAASAALGFIVAFYHTPAGTTADMARTMTPFCTGTLITSRVVLTAAHCFYGDGAYSIASVDSVSVRIEGEWDRLIPLSALRLHPSFVSAAQSDTVKDGSTLAPYDVAVAQLSQQATTTPAYGAASASFEPTVGQELMIAGYGDSDQSAMGDRDGSATTNTMHYATVQYMANQCPRLLPGTVCAGGLSTTCQGDSGGPLMARNAAGLWFVLGITSYGPLCGNAAVGEPEWSVYTDVRVHFGDIGSMIASLP